MNLIYESLNRKIKGSFIPIKYSILQMFFPLEFRKFFNLRAFRESKKRIELGLFLIGKTKLIQIRNQLLSTSNSDI